MALATSSSSAEPRLSWRRSMRFRIAVSVSGFALLIILAQAMAQLMMLEQTEEELIDESLGQQIAYTLQAWRHSHELAAPNTPYMRLYHLPPGGTGADIPANLASLPLGNHEVFEDEREYHVAVRADDGHRFILAFDVQEHEERLGALAATVVTGALAMGALMMAMVYALSGRLTRRLERLAAEVSRGRRGESYVQPGMERELVVVARALDLHEARHEALLERERSITANLSHELRTPLAAIRSDAELLGTMTELPEPARRRSGRIVESVDRIAELAGSLLMLARDAQPRMVEQVRLREALLEAWEGLAARRPGTVALRLEVAGSVVVRADLSLLQLVLRNLLDNASRYAVDGEVHCRFGGTMLEVRDRGPGFAPEELAHVFERFYRGGSSPGHGLGLALVRHVCLASGWSVTAANAPGGGARVCVDFGAAAGA